MSVQTEIQNYNSYWGTSFSRKPVITLNDEPLQYSGEFKIVSDGDAKTEEVVGNYGEVQSCEAAEKPAGIVAFGFPSTMASRMFISNVVRSKERFVLKALDQEQNICLTITNAYFETQDETTFGATSVDLRVKGGKINYTRA